MNFEQLDERLRIPTNRVAWIGAAGVSEVAAAALWKSGRRAAAAVVGLAGVAAAGLAAREAVESRARVRAMNEALDNAQAAYKAREAQAAAMPEGQLPDAPAS